MGVSEVVVRVRFSGVGLGRVEGLEGLIDMDQKSGL